MSLLIFHSKELCDLSAWHLLCCSMEERKSLRFYIKYRGFFLQAVTETVSELPRTLLHSGGWYAGETDMAAVTPYSIMSMTSERSRELLRVWTTIIFLSCSFISHVPHMGNTLGFMATLIFVVLKHEFTQNPPKHDLNIMIH